MWIHLKKDIKYRYNRNNIYYCGYYPNNIKDSLQLLICFKCIIQLIKDPYGKKKKYK